MQVKNKTFDAAGTAEQQAEYHFLTPSDAKPRVYLEPAVSGGCLFSQVDVEVDGYPVDTPRVGTKNWIYTAFNRTFCSEQIKLAKYGGPIARVSNENERKPALAAASLTKALKGLNFEGKLVSKPVLLRWSPDGVFPFDSQSNICRASSGVERANGFLPPGINLLFRFAKRDKLHHLLDNADVVDTAYYADTAVDVGDQFEYKFELKGMEISYEILTLPHPLAKTIKKKKKKKSSKKSKEEEEEEKKYRWAYFADVPRILTHGVAGKEEVTTNTVSVPAGAKFVALTWMKNQQLFFTADKFKSLSARFHFPPGARRVTLTLDGKNQLFEKGLVNCGLPADAHVSRSCRDYHQMLVHNDFYSRPFEVMFPSAGASYDGFFVVDLSNRVIKAPTDLEIEVEYNTASEERWHLCSIVVQTHKYTYKEGKGLTEQLQV